MQTITKQRTKQFIVKYFNCFKKFYRSYEIIIVADGKPVELNKKFLDDKNIKYFQNTKNLGSGLTRHFGVINSKYDIIFFIDSDTEIRGNFLDVIESNLRNKPIDGIIGS